MKGNEHTADEWENWLRNNDVVLMFCDEDGAIHYIEVDEGKLSWMDRGKYGYDEETSRELLEEIATSETNVKPIKREDELVERKKVAGGEYDTAEEWAEDGPIAVTV